MSYTQKIFPLRLLSPYLLYIADTSCQFFPQTGEYIYAGNVLHATNFPNPYRITKDARRSDRLVNSTTGTFTFRLDHRLSPNPVQRADKIHSSPAAILFTVCDGVQIAFKFCSKGNSNIEENKEPKSVTFFPNSVGMLFLLSLHTAGLNRGNNRRVGTRPAISFSPRFYRATPRYTAAEGCVFCGNSSRQRKHFTNGNLWNDTICFSSHDSQNPSNCITDPWVSNT